MNTQKGFSRTIVIVAVLVLLLVGVEAGKAFVHSFNEGEANKERAESYREYVQNNANKSLKFENSDYSFNYSSDDDCIKVNNEYLDKEGKEGLWVCPGSSVSAIISGNPDETIKRLIFSGGPDLDGIWGKACFSDSEKNTPNGYVVRYFENPEPGVIKDYGDCGMHPTLAGSAESVGTVNIYFVINPENNNYVLIEDVNNSTSTAMVWEIINSFKFK